MRFRPVFPDLTRPVIIAGPCSAETEEQVLDTARQIADLGTVSYYRAGIWKPRTKPGQFEGVGREGLAWLQTVKQETGLKICTEVASTAHVYEALKHGIDLLWIGARSTVNPFTMQEIADALQGVDIPVLVKNPVNADLDLWLGGIERIQKAGIDRVGVIHRGFSHFGQKKYRNVPLWQLPIELMRRLPGMTIIGDPSHICGNRENLMDIAQQGLDLNYNGLMIETHRDPDVAWSDAKQQVTPARLKEMLATLVIRDKDTVDRTFQQKISVFRREIDRLDDELLNLLSHRMDVSERIGEVKRESQVSIFQPSRWNEILEKACEKGRERGLSEDLVTGVLRAIHQESINRQNLIMQEISKLSDL